MRTRAKPSEPVQRVPTILDVLRTLGGLKQSVLQRQAEDAVLAEQRRQEDAALAKLPTLDDICDVYIQQVLDLCGGNRQRTAQILGIGRTSLYRYMCASQLAKNLNANT